MRSGCAAAVEVESARNKKTYRRAALRCLGRLAREWPQHDRLAALQATLCSILDGGPEVRARSSPQRRAVLNRSPQEEEAVATTTAGAVQQRADRKEKEREEGLLAQQAYECMSRMWPRARLATNEAPTSHYRHVRRCRLLPCA